MLEELIPELFDEILGLLDLRGLISLRLASPQLQRRSRAAFGAVAFSTISVDFSRANLQWLSRIGSSEFRLAVRKLRVGNWGDKSKYNRGIPYGDDGYWLRLESGIVDADSHLARQFVAAVSLFPNCTTAVVTDSRARHCRPGEDWTPEENLSSADAVELVLRAYSVPGAPPIQRLHIRIQSGRDWVLPALISESRIASAQRACATHLQELVIEFKAREDEYLARMLGLITASPNLRTLTLMWHCYGFRDSNQAGYRLGQHLEGFSGFIPPLEHLELARIALRETSVLRLLSGCHRTLKTLAFNRVGINPGPWVDILRHLQDGQFYGLRRISLQGCRDVSDNSTLAFCPLREAQERLQETCGGTFEFRYSRTAQRAMELHVVGVLFETESGTSAMKAGLKALIEHSHGASDEAGVTPPCANLREIRKLPQTFNYISRFNPCGGRWSSLNDENHA